jgi:3-oxoadipate enol-lactonase
VCSSDLAAIAAAQRAMANRRDQTDLLSQIHCPTLVLAGNEDTLIAPSEAAAMVQLLPKARIKIIPETGHLLPLEKPKIFQKHFSEFILNQG